MKKNNNDDILGALLGAAILGGLCEQEKPEAEEAPQMTVEHRAARKARALYNAFIMEGFSDEQATTFVAAIMS